jgi:hypothetical protein
LGIEKEVLPSLAAQLHAATGQQKRDVERQLFQAQQTLLALRKESRAYQKLISDIEIKTTAAREGLISFNWVLDCQTKCFMPLYSFLRSISRFWEEKNALGFDYSHFVSLAIATISIASALTVRHSVLANEVQ